MDTSIVSAVTKLGLEAVIILWVLLLFTRELRDIIRAMNAQAATLAAVQALVQAVMSKVDERSEGGEK